MCEWGPDIVYLRIPPAFVGTIKAYRVFYPLDVPSRVVSGSRVFESRLLEGTPAAYGAVKGAHGEVQIIGCIAWPIESHLKGEYDYIDVEAHLVKLAEGENFGGVSGGGLWKVLIYNDPVTGKIDSEAILEGVAFWQISVENGRGLIRCHGLKSIQAAMPSTVARVDGNQKHPE